MYPSLDLLGSLRSVPFVKDRISAIKRKATIEDQNDALLECLLEAPNDIHELVINRFLLALRSCGQEHVANIIRRESDKVPMSDEHCNALRDDIDQLCLFTDPENGLLLKLVKTKVISFADAERIRSMSGSNEMSRKLIEMLTRKSDDAFDGLINALNQTGQSHVAYLLTGEGDSRPLNEEHIKKLTRNRDCMVNTINSKSSNLITALRSKGVFSEYDEQRVTNVKPDTNYDRNELILNLIARKSQSDFFDFISALRDSDHEHVVMILIGAEFDVNVETVYEAGADVADLPEVDAQLLEHMQATFQSNGDAALQLNQQLSHSGVSVTGVNEGSIKVTFSCENVESLQHFREPNDCGKLEQIFNEAFCSRFANKGLKSLRLVISEEQFDRCSQTFGRCMPMTSEHRKALLSSQDRLVDMIKVSGDFLDRLFMRGRRREAIEGAETQEQQVKTLIDTVSRQPDSAFAQFLNALKGTDQHEAAAVITGDDMNETKSTESVLDLHERHTEDPSPEESQQETCESQDTCDEDVRNQAEHNLDTLLSLIGEAEAGRGTEDFWPMFHRICATARDVAGSRRNLCEQYSAPVGRTSHDEESVSYELSPVHPSPIQSPVSSEGSDTSYEHPGELFSYHSFSNFD